MHSAIVSVLNGMGYEVNQRPYEVIDRCDRGTARTRRRSTRACE